ncbi:MAG: hypothetical protein IJH65_04105 [Methanobrevibacter sp.]|nr:hypothetical protein [Methanobrevibacter sp.]
MIITILSYIAAIMILLVVIIGCAYGIYLMIVNLKDDIELNKIFRDENKEV